MKYTISILAHNNLALTKRCVESVLKHSDNFELIVTDNGSADGTAEWLSAETREPGPITRLFYRQNKGFIQANLNAHSIARGEWTVLLNNDTCVPEGWLEALEAPFLSDPLCAISGVQGCALDDNFLGHPSKHVEYIEGSCLMIRTSLARKIGLFDPQLIGCYGEDADLGLRVREMGYTIHTVPIDIKHLGGATSSMVPQANAWLTQNLAYLKKKWASYLYTRHFDAPPHATD